MKYGTRIVVIAICDIVQISHTYPWVYLFVSRLDLSFDMVHISYFILYKENKYSKTKNLSEYVKQNFQIISQYQETFGRNDLPQPGKKISDYDHAAYEYMHS